MTKKPNLPVRLWRKLPFSGAGGALVTHIDLVGTIGPDSRTGRSLNLKKVEKALDAAFKPKNLQAVAISINSPGGSPVQSRLIHDRIRLLAAEKKVPVLTFIEDVGASGGYILAIAGDEIFADESSIVGSIGVIAGGFGFVEAIDKLGVDRRVYTAGKNKSQLDPFQPENKEDIKRFKQMLDLTHDIFKGLVKERRGAKLDEARSEEIFSGQFWIADPAMEMGLIDGIGHLRQVIESRYGKDVEIKKIATEEKSFVAKLLGAKIPGIDSGEIIAGLDEKAHWSRFGL
ncbi:MAG: S49 family peptidase [Parvularculaceae bacterium]